jgi:DNA mismatch repair protein MutS
MANELLHLSVHTMAISDDGQGDIVFLHRVTPGCTGRSYGVHVAKLAGMPPNVVKRAEEVLKQLETDKDIRRLLVAETNGRYDLPVGTGLIASAEPVPTTHYKWQSEEARLVAQTLEQANGAEPDLNVIDVCAITPLDALNLLFLMQKRRSKISRSRTPG